MNLKKNDCLETPDWVYNKLGVFDLDPCAGPSTTIGIKNYSISRGEDGLLLPWNGFVWCNPPFSQKEIWINKMKLHMNGILILPERASAPWFGPLAEFCKTYFIMGKKINFLGGSSSNNLGSVLFPFGGEALDRIKNSNLPGLLVEVKSFKARY